MDTKVGQTSALEIGIQFRKSISVMTYLLDHRRMLTLHIGQPLVGAEAVVWDVTVASGNGRRLSSTRLKASNLRTYTQGMAISEFQMSFVILTCIILSRYSMDFFDGKHNVVVRLIGF